MPTMLGHESPPKKEIGTTSPRYHSSETLPPAPKSPMAKGCSKLGLGEGGVNWHLFTAIEGSWLVVEPTQKKHVIVKLDHGPQVKNKKWFKPPPR